MSLFFPAMKKNKGEGLKVGSEIPGVKVFDTEGNPLSLRELCNQGIVLLYFFPKAFTPGCTLQACHLRDRLSDLQQHKIKVYGISKDKPCIQKKFSQSYRLNFCLLSDLHGEACKTFGVPLFLGMPKRVSFLIKEGKLLWRDFHPHVERTADDVLEAIAASMYWPKD
ncbi:peroxiredoxin [Candidatus Methylacidiphilum infernorum]|uniref:peroxiredoxin n=1 Tax=Candidatus Methylacidiphilum infernorum TaxID=511746 RepID=UPI001F5CEA0E|nr:peroxiredoxin [Candidatus Methylacidiphilum infernorum]